MTFGADSLDTFIATDKPRQAPMQNIERIHRHRLVTHLSILNLLFLALQLRDGRMSRQGALQTAGLTASGTDIFLGTCRDRDWPECQPDTSCCRCYAYAEHSTDSNDVVPLQASQGGSTLSVLSVTYLKCLGSIETCRLPDCQLDTSRCRCFLYIGA